jgi:hypothetical protein
LNIGIFGTVSPLITPISERIHHQRKTVRYSRKFNPSKSLFPVARRPSLKRKHSVILEAVKWLEKAERKRAWFSAEEAAALVDEGGLALIIGEWR